MLLGYGDVTADAGYESEENYTYFENKGHGMIYFKQRRQTPKKLVLSEKAERKGKYLTLLFGLIKEFYDYASN